MEIRGGYGCGQVIPLLDFDLIAAHPKPFVGMSDITLLHLALGRLAGLVTFWGPTCVQIGRPGSDYSLDRFLKLLRGEIAPVGGGDGVAATRTLCLGRARGMLVGGTTSLLAASLGTSYEVETEGRVLLLEDVDVEPYEIDRCLTQLLHAGKRAPVGLRASAWPQAPRRDGSARRERGARRRLGLARGARAVVQLRPEG